MSKLIIHMAQNKFIIGTVWIILLIPILAVSITSDIFYSPIMFVLLVFYLRKEQKYIYIVAILYGFFILFPPYLYFIRWISLFLAGDISIKECLEQIYSLVKVRSTTYFNLPSAICAVLAIPSIYLINLRNRLKKIHAKETLFQKE
ncbi:hypothetical protein F3J02_01245 [Acinetobacter sp. Tr-809]|uniref:hypothetical protein n=1 Tax=Acinetobacter sp. Tr-809 TaxID=2608324 RepID=UPI00141E1415|nr:hypothetical protein [Acinetobacter sp. Tr-809]NIE95123.1 hypothetical protein [Acinetobacter sp. Tr-809]